MSLHKSIAAAVLVAAANLIVPAANAATMDFSTISCTGANICSVPDGTVLNGFAITSNNQHQLYTIGSGNATYYDGAPALFNNGTAMSVTQAGGGAFNFDAITLAPFTNGDNDIGDQVTFFGNLKSGGSVSDTVTITSNSPTTYQITGLDGVVGVGWAQTYNGLQINSFAVTPSVPVPAAGLLMASGLAVLGAGRRQQKTNVPG